MVSIIDYGMGNVASVQRALDVLEIASKITDDFALIESSDAIVLPGVGSFQQGMDNLRNRGLDKFLTDQVLVKQKKFFGICLGMQLLFSDGTEPVPCKGLGWLEGRVAKLNIEGLRVPHMGWNSIEVHQSGYLNSLSGQDFYFIHSYHVIPAMNDMISATTSYGGNIVAAVQSRNIFATQFHPEKSQFAGMTLLRRFFLDA